MPLKYKNSVKTLIGKHIFSSFLFCKKEKTEKKKKKTVQILKIIVLADQRNVKHTETKLDTKG